MQIGPYAVERETIPSIAICFVDALRLRLRGVPALSGDTPVAIAKQVLKNNARGVLHAGSGHFWFMWVSDFGKALRGAEKVLSPTYLGKLIRFMIAESMRKGRVTSCFTPTHGFDLPYYRSDSLPWLIYSVAEFTRWTGDKSLIEENRPALQVLLKSYERTHFGRDDLIDSSVTGDWMDTVLRPSSTYNNLCALKMLELSRGLGLNTAHEAAALAARILKDRWKGDHFIDYAGSDRFSVDAAVFALYFGQFSKELREKAIASLELSGAAEPFPIRSALEPYPVALLSPLAHLTAKYHSAIWPHLGFVYLNGLRRAGKDVSRRKAKMENLIMRYRNLLETVDAQGRPYHTMFLSCEYGLSMCAGQYLELALD